MAEKKAVSTNGKDFEEKIRDVADVGLDRISEFLSADRGMGSESWERIADQAKVAAFAVGSFVRHEAAANNREALEQQRRRRLSKL